jgi:hypothetical protein
MVPDTQRGFDCVGKDAVEIDKRAAARFFFAFYPKELTHRAGTVYLAPIADSNGGGHSKLARRTGSGFQRTFLPDSSGR